VESQERLFQCQSKTFGNKKAAAVNYLFILGTYWPNFNLLGVTEVCKEIGKVPMTNHWFSSWKHKARLPLCCWRQAFYLLSGL